MTRIAERLERALAGIPEPVRERHVAGSAICALSAATPPWVESGLDLEAGCAFTVFAAGRVVLSEEAGLFGGPRFYLWARVGGRGPLLNGAQDTASFEAPQKGALELGICLGEWASRDGAIDATPYAAGQGAIDVLVVVWKDDAARGVAALAAAAPDEPLFAAERERLANPVVRPAGWDYLWLLGQADIFSERELDGAPAVSARTHDDVGILQKRVDLPFTPDTRLRWRWRVSELPSPRAENTLPTHDYLSLAVEFENGQDLTYYWSAELPAGTHYRCPLPNWERRETHWVVRSGSAGLGEWHAEERPLYDDYVQAVGEPPQRIVGVWLIAVSIFQKRSGRAEFAEIELASGSERRSLLERH